MQAAIKVEGLSKRYRIGRLPGLNSYSTLRETISEIVLHPFRQLRQGAALGRTEEFWALKDVSFSVEPGDVIGIVGRNGAGKSTLLRILSGITSPTMGRVELRGRVGTLLEVGTGFHPELTGRENIFLNGSILGMNRREVQRQFDKIVDFSGVAQFLDTPVKRYSSGMTVRLAFAVAAHLNPKILFVDEVLAVGDVEFQKKCLGKMSDVAREGRTVLFVSHNMAAIKNLCRRAILLEHGTIALDGSVNEVVDRYLLAGTEMTRTGVIPNGVSGWFNGEARICRVRLLDSKGQDTTQLYYDEPLRVVIDVEVYNRIVDAVVEISVSLLDGLQVTFSTSFDSEGILEFREMERHVVSAEIDVTFQPRTYTLTVGLHHSDGRTMDFLERTLDFEILQVGLQNGDSSRWGVCDRGFVRNRGHWKVSSATKAGNAAV